MQSTEKPLVSIVIPVYNGSNFMREAIDSALSQTYSNCEILVINDGSNDGGQTEEIAKSYGYKIRYFSKENGGVSSALNMGIQNMRGDFFCWLSHDDVYLPQKVEAQVDDLLRFTDKRILSLCGYSLANESLQTLKRQPKSTLRSNQVLSGEETLELLFREDTFNGCALLIPKTAFDLCGGFDVRLRFNQDAFMWYKIFLFGFSLTYTSYRGVMQRTHGAQLTQTGQATFHSDCMYMSGYMIPRLVQAGLQSKRLLFWYMVYNAKHNHEVIVNACLQSGEKDGLFGPKDVMAAWAVLAYGKVKPLISRVYYFAVKGKR